MGGPGGTEFEGVTGLLSREFLVGEEQPCVGTVSSGAIGACDGATDVLSRAHRTGWSPRASAGSRGVVTGDLLGSPPPFRNRK